MVLNTVFFWCFWSKIFDREQQQQEQQEQEQEQQQQEEQREEHNDTL